MQTLGQCLICHSPRIKAIDPKIDIGQCLDCGFVFANPRPTSEEIADCYSKLDKYDSWLSHETARQALWKRRLKKLKKHAPKGPLLDIGAGIGQFLSLTRHEYPKVAGTETSRTAVAIAKEKYDLTLLTGALETVYYVN